MRFWVVLAAVAIALSGCIGGHVTGKPRDDNATAGADASGDGLDEAPPWALKGTNETDGQKDGVTAGGKGDSKDPDATPTGQDDGSTDDSPPDEGEPGEGGSGGEDGSDPVGDVLDDASTEGASGTEDVVDDSGETVGGTLEDATSDGSKDPLAGIVSVVVGLLG